MVDDDHRGNRAEAGDPTADGSIAAGSPHDLGNLPTAADETIVPSWGPSSFAALPEPGYQLGELIGRGGMGEVVAARDLRIGREVAVKRIRAREPSHDAVERFLREARIQARLDHPAIVPVYEMGTDADGRPYFTMKRLAGVTLAKRLTQGAAVQPLLRAFVDVCLAIQLAHSRGVVHRDLKPSNIMLGDYGEVYVLDWGVARVLTDTQRTTGPAMAVTAGEGGTTAGAILGTPGYMSPEQVRGHEAGSKADVYALGAILFEILAGEPLHPRGEAALGSTLTSPQDAPTRRVAERRQIPPELDGVCFDALAEEPDQRPTARELADRVQAYLDGDRDIERRRALAAAQLSAAREAMQSTSPEARATAMRRAGRALALDPESAEAAALVTTLLLEPPASYPPDLKASLAEEDRAFNRVRSRQGAWAYAALFTLWLGIPFLQVENWATLLAFYGVAGLGAAVALRTSKTGISVVPVTLIMSTLTVLLFSRLAGPLVITPIVICAGLMQMAAIRAMAERLWLYIGWAAVTVILPFALEWAGVLPHSFTVEGGLVVIRSDVFVLDGFSGMAALIIANFVFLISAGLVAVMISRRRLEAARQLQVQSWHLRQLLPTMARPWQTKVGR
jgi:eukaryotic-like serine/threonine-protein kinase